MRGDWRSAGRGAWGACGGAGGRLGGRSRRISRSGLIQIGEEMRPDFGPVRGHISSKTTTKSTIIVESRIPSFRLARADRHERRRNCVIDIPPPSLFYRRPREKSRTARG